MKIRKWGLSLSILLISIFVFTGCQLIPQLLQSNELPANVEEYSRDGLEQSISDLIFNGENHLEASYKNSSRSMNTIIKDDVDWLHESNYLFSSLVDDVALELTEEEGYTVVNLDLVYQDGEQPKAAVSSRDDLLQNLSQGIVEKPSVNTIVLDGMTYTRDEFLSIIMTAEINAGLSPSEPKSYFYESFNSTDGRQILKATLDMPYLDEELAPKRDELIEKVSLAASSITPGDLRSQYEQIYYYVMNAAEYDNYLAEQSEPGLLTDEMHVQRSAYGALVQGSTVCTGYARSFKAICDALDMPCWVVAGTVDGVGHMWNMVPLDGAMYYIDCTFGDTGESYERSFLITFDALGNQGYVLDENNIIPEQL